MATTVDPITQQQRSSALTLLQQLFTGFDGKIYFGFNGNTYQYTGTNADGTINALDLTTNTKTASIDPISIVASNASSLGPAANQTTAQAVAQSSMTQTLMSLLGTGTQLYGSLKQASAFNSSKNQPGGGSTIPMDQILRIGANNTAQYFDLSKAASSTIAQNVANELKAPIGQVQTNIASLNQQIVQLKGNITANSQNMSSAVSTLDSYDSNPTLLINKYGMDPSSLQNLTNDVTFKAQQAFTSQIQQFGYQYNALDAKIEQASTAATNAQAVIDNPNSSPTDIANAKVALIDAKAQIFQDQGAQQALVDNWTTNYSDIDQYVSNQVGQATALYNSQLKQYNDALGQIANDGVPGQQAQLKDLQSQLAAAKQNLSDLQNKQQLAQSVADSYQQNYNAATSQLTTADLYNGTISDASIQLAKDQVGASASDDNLLKQIIKNNQGALSTPFTPDEIQKAIAQATAQQSAQYDAYYQNDLADYQGKLQGILDANGAGYNPEASAPELEKIIQDAGLDNPYVAPIPINQPKLDSTSQSVIQNLYTNRLTSSDTTALLHDLNTSEIKGGITLVSTIGTAFGFESQMESLWANFSVKTFATTVGLFAGFVTSMHILNGAITHILGDLGSLGSNATGMLNTLLSSAPGTALLNGLKWATNGYGTGIATLALGLIAWLNSRKESAEELAASQLIQEISPNIWSDGPVIQMITSAGAALATIGILVGPGAGPMQRTLPQSAITTALSTATGGQMPSDAQRYGSVFYLPGSGSQPTEVVYLTPSGTDANGNALETVHVAPIAPDVTFQNPGSNTYIPFFVKDSNGNPIANPQVANALTGQNAFLQCADGSEVSIYYKQGCAAHGGTLSHAPSN